MCRSAWKSRKDGGRPLTPAEVYDLTPHQLYAMFWVVRHAPKADAESDALAAHNRLRATRGLQPVWPSWLMRGVPRKG